MAYSTRPNFQYSLLAAAVLAVWSASAVSASLVLSPAPLFVTTTAKANVLLMFSNANNMDEDPTGLAVGSGPSGVYNPAYMNSKSDIARTAARSLVANYTGKINMGLMAYQQSSVAAQWLNQSPYDASYNPANYNASFTGSRASTTKKFKAPNPTSSNATGACTTSSGAVVDCVYYNVNLPFYSGGPQGNSFCYSGAASFDNGSETYPSGPWDTYKCYSKKTGFSDSAPSGTSTSASANNGNGYGTYIGSGAFSPTDSDLAQNILDFGKINVSFDVGPTWFSNGSPGKGYLHTPVANLDTTQAGKLNTKLATSVVPTYSGGTYNTNPTGISGGNTPTNPNAPLQNAGLSPITGTFLTAKDYFNGATTNFGSAQGGAVAAPPNSCNKDFAVFLTNGLPNVTSTGTTPAYVAGLPYSPAEVSNAVTAVGSFNSGTRPVKTYVIGFALPQFTQDYFTVNPLNPLDQMAAAGGTTNAYYANNLVSLNSTFSSIFNTILAQAGSAAAVALSSGSVVAGGKVYQGQFNSADWSGDLVAFNINTSTGATIATPTVWNAGAQLNAQASGTGYNTGRNIISFKPSTSTGIPFRWPANPLLPTSTELDTSQVSALNTSPTGTVDTNGANRLNFVRGDTSQSGVRVRSISVMGDIADSAPTYVGAPDSGYSDSLEALPYSSYSSSNASRTAMIYVGANDGMLHGFDAATGNEKLAYVPSQVYANLTQLTSPTYTHRYFVNGSPYAEDVFYGSAWHTVLVSGLAGGGQGYFALDVTDPTTFSETNAATLARWEFTDSNDADLGYSYSQPTIAKLNNGKWAAIFGNGYNNTDADSHASTTGHAVLYIVDIQTGALIKKIDTGYGTTSTPNGLATPAVLDADGNATADTVYAGDLAGNLWKFDISGATPSSWGVAYASGGAPAPLFVAKDSLNNRQPITVQPDVVGHPSGATYGWLVTFGTGKYIETGDSATTASQSFYGVQDNGAVVARSDLVQQTITSTTSVGTPPNTFRTLSSNAVNWSGGTVHGWYLDLPTSGERVISASTASYGKIIFTTAIPSTAACSAGGSGWLMELDILTGGALSAPNIDVNRDGSINNSDYITTPGNYAAGIAVDGIPSAVTIQKFGTKTMIRYSTTKSTVPQGEGGGGGSQLGRTTWREIIQ